MPSLKAISSLKPAPNSKKKKSESTAAEIIDIMKPESGDKNIKLGDSIPVVELDKISLTGRRKDIPPPGTPQQTVPTYAPDEETKSAAEVFKMLQK